MLAPRKVKYKKIHKAKVYSTDIDRSFYFNYVGVYSLKALEAGRVSGKQLESLKKVVSKQLKKYGNVFLTVFPDKSITKKPAEVRMGKGKGSHFEWVCLVKQGRILLEVMGNNLPSSIIKNALRLGGEKLSIKTKIVLMKL